MVDLIVFGLILLGAHIITRLITGLIYYLELLAWMKKNEAQDVDEVIAAVPVSQFMLHFHTFVMFALTYIGLDMWWR